MSPREQAFGRFGLYSSITGLIALIHVAIWLLSGFPLASPALAGGIVLTALVMLVSGGWLGVPLIRWRRTSAWRGEALLAAALFTSGITISWALSFLDRGALAPAFSTLAVNGCVGVTLAFQAFGSHRERGR